MKQVYFIAILGCIALSSCDPFGGRTSSSIPDQVEGWAPVYKEFATIEAGSPRDIKDEGKIYKLGSTLYQIESGEGIHVIDISNPSAPVKKSFITVTGAQEIAIKNNYLYTNNINDLVVLDISNPANIKAAHRAANVFKIVDQYAPPSGGYYECPDAAKGIVVGWEQTTLYQPKCRK